MIDRSNTQGSDSKSGKSSFWEDLYNDPNYEQSVKEFWDSIDVDAVIWNIEHMHGKDPNIIYSDDLASLASDLKSGKINTDGMHIPDSNSGRIIKEDLADSDNKPEK